jgi:hypothetical protein
MGFLLIVGQARSAASGFGALMAIPTDACPRQPEDCGLWQSHKHGGSVGTPVHTRRLFRKGVKNVWFGSQAHSDFLRFYKSAHPDGFLLTFISQLVAMAARKIVPQAV